MKKLIIFLFVSAFFSAQKKEIIKLNRSIKNEKSLYRGFVVSDRRDTQVIGTVTSQSEPVEVVFEGSATEEIKEWFFKHNTLQTGDQLVLMLEKIKISEDKKQKFAEGKLDFRASTFLRKADGYHFLKKKDTVITITYDVTPNMAQNLSRKTTAVLADLLLESYGARPWVFAIQENELSDYDRILNTKIDETLAKELKEGVYRDAQSFFSQNPERGFEIKTNKEGIIKRAEKGYEVQSIHRFYAFVYKGKAYKMVPAGYAELVKDDKGSYINVTYNDLFPPTNNNATTYGAMAGGLVGALIGAAIDSGKKKNDGSGQELTHIYLDPLTGKYILPEDFGKKDLTVTDKK